MKSVLVVDDEQGYRDLYRFLLEPKGVQVTCVVNGLEALNKVKQCSYDLILMDVHMPVMTGPEAIVLIKKIRPDQKILVFSSSSDPGYFQEDQALKNGANECLYKPVELKVLEEVLDGLM